MGGRGSGGHPGTGPRPQEAVDLTGPLPEVEKPVGMPADEGAVWDRLALFARQKRTLQPHTVEAFALLCKQIVRERELDADPDTRNTPNHRGMMQRVEAGLADFGLAPSGKPVAAPVSTEKPKNALEQLQAARPHLRAIG